MSLGIEKQYVRGPQTTSGLPNQLIPETPQLNPRNTLIWHIISQIGATSIKQRALEVLMHCRGGGGEEEAPLDSSMVGWRQMDPDPCRSHSWLDHSEPLSSSDDDRIHFYGAAVMMTQRQHRRCSAGNTAHSVKCHLANKTQV